jgi:hypothetical protein
MTLGRQAQLCRLPADLNDRPENDKLSYVELAWNLGEVISYLEPSAMNRAAEGPF